MLSRAELYEFHASECVRAAGRMDNPELRERFLRSAREWMLDIANLPRLSECGAPHSGCRSVTAAPLGTLPAGRD